MQTVSLTLSHWQMGTLRVHMKGVLLWLVHWKLRAGPRDFGPALAALVVRVQIIFFHHLPLFQLICRHRLASWADSRAGSSVS
jgi:hypothetical protein